MAFRIERMDAFYMIMAPRGELRCTERLRGSRVSTQGLRSSFVVPASSRLDACHTRIASACLFNILFLREEMDNLVDRALFETTCRNGSLALSINALLCIITVWDVMVWYE